MDLFKKYISETFVGFRRLTNNRRILFIKIFVGILSVTVKNTEAQIDSSFLCNYHFIETLNANNFRSSNWNWDTVVTYDTLGVIANRYIQILNENKQMDYTLIESWSNNSWTNSYKLTNHYDSVGRIKFLLGENWKNNTWEYATKTSNFYNSQNLIVQRLYENWYNNSWVNNSRHTTYYDANGKITSATSEYAQSSTTWVNMSRQDIFYNSNNTLNYYIIEQFMQPSYKKKHTYTYNSTGTCLKEENYNWESNEWLLSRKDTIFYDSNGNIISLLLTDWINNVWVNNSRYNYIYNYDGNSIEGEIELWSNGNWRNYLGSLALYSNKKPINYFGYFHKYKAQFKSVGASVFQNEQSDFLKVYPNPSAGIFYIMVGSVEEEVTLTVTNTLDQVVKTQKGNTAVRQTIDIRDAAPGTYFVEISTPSNGKTVKKVVKN